MSAAAAERDTEPRAGLRVEALQPVRDVGMETTDTNPVRGVERAREEARDRVLDSGELATLAAALDQLEEKHPASVATIRVAALTGLRISEVCSIHWEHVDFESGRVTLPETKTGRRA